MVAFGPGAMVTSIASRRIGRKIDLEEDLQLRPLAAVAEALGTGFLVLKALGVLYLLALAWRMWHAPTVLAPEARADGSRRQPWRLFWAKLLVSLGNPKNMVFYVALLPSRVDLGPVGVTGWAELVATTVAVLAAVDLAWAAAAAGAQRWLVNGRTMRLVNRVGASMMAGAAVAAR